MHRSRLTSIFFDCDEQSYQRGVRFWSAALGIEGEALGKRKRYTRLRGGDLDVPIQRTTDEDPGMHVDIETDDIEAEVRRLEALGARCKRDMQSWQVMEDPAGHAFCVVQPVSVDWPAGASEWR